MYQVGKIKQPKSVTTRSLAPEELDKRLDALNKPDWEKRFDEKLARYVHRGVLAGMIKEFITQELQAKQDRILELENHILTLQGHTYD